MLINQPCWKPDVSAQGENKTVQKPERRPLPAMPSATNHWKKCSQSKRLGGDEHLDVYLIAIYKISANYSSEIPTGYVVNPLSFSHIGR